MTHSRVTSLLAVVAVGMLAIGVFAGAGAAATTTLAGDGTDYITDFNASSSNNFTYTLNSDGTDFGTDSTDTVYLNVTANDEHVQVSNSSISSTASSYTFSVPNDELGTVPGDASENTTITVNAWGEGADGSVNTSVDTFDATLGFQDDYAVVYAGDSAADEQVSGLDVENDNASSFFGLGSEQASTTVDADNVGLGQNASGTDVTVLMANTSGEDPFSQAQERGLISSASENGDFIRFHSLYMDDNPHAVFVSEAPDSVLSDVTYAETTTVNGVDGMTVHVGDEYDGESSVDVTAGANDKYGFGDAIVIEDKATDGFFADGISPISTNAGHLTAGA